MKVVQFDSPAISQISYFGRWQLLDVQFTSGSVYRYRGVSRELFLELADSKHIGHKYNKVVKGKFASRKVN